MDRINIGPDELETFIAVSTLGSFRRAAEKLGVSQPSVTSRVQRLETILGVKLLNRTTRRVTTTEAGERLRLRAEHTVTVLQKISNATADLALIPFAGNGTEFDFEHLFDDEFIVVAPHEHPIARKDLTDFEEISRYPLLTLPSESAVWYTMRDEFERRGLRFEPAFQAHNLFTLVGLVEAGLGLTLLPQIIVTRLNLNAVSTVRIRDGAIRRHIGIVTLRGRALAPAVSAFVKSLRSLRDSAVVVDAPRPTGAAARRR